MLGCAGVPGSLEPERSLGPREVPRAAAGASRRRDLALQEHTEPRKAAGVGLVQGGPTLGVHGKAGHFPFPTGGCLHDAVWAWVKGNGNSVHLSFLPSSMYLYFCASCRVGVPHMNPWLL